MDESTPHRTPPGPRHWLDEPRHVRLLWRGFLGVLALTVLAEFAVHLHPAFAIESVFGFHAWFGLLACLAMIVGAKALSLVLRRPDSYYDGDKERDD
jgi:hypothetical protein